MTVIDKKIETEMLDFIKQNIKRLLKPEGSGPANPGICEYSLVTTFRTLTSYEIGDYLMDLERIGKLRYVGQKRSDGLVLPKKCYLPV